MIMQKPVTSEHEKGDVFVYVQSLAPTKWMINEKNDFICDKKFCCY